MTMQTVSSANALRNALEGQAARLDQIAALLAGALAVQDPADRRHLLLLARQNLAHRDDIVSIDADGLIEDALAATMEADTSALVELARGMLIEAASELDTALAA